MMMFSSWKAHSATTEANRRRKSEHTYISPLGLDAAASEETFQEMKEFIKSFYATFYSRDAQKNRNELLEKYPDDLEKFHTQLVPGVVVEEEFWQRYFYRCDERRIMAQMKLSTYLRENVQSLGSVVGSTIQSYKSPTVQSSEQQQTPSSTTLSAPTTTKSFSSSGGKKGLLLQGDSLVDQKPDRSNTAASSSASNNKQKIVTKSTTGNATTTPKTNKNVYRPPMLRNSRAEALKAPSTRNKNNSSQKAPITPTNKQFREQKNNSSSSSTQQNNKHEDSTASKHDSLALSGVPKRSYYYGVVGTILVLVFLTIMMMSGLKRVACEKFEFYGKSVVCNDDIVVARGSAVEIADTTKPRNKRSQIIEKDRNDNSNIGGWFGGGGGGAFGGVSDDVDGSDGVQAMISSWMQNVDFSHIATAAAETTENAPAPDIVEIKKPENKRGGIVGFFQRRFGRRKNDDDSNNKAVSANTSPPGVVVHQHIHHVVHHVVHEMQ